MQLRDAVVAALLETSNHVGWGGSGAGHEFPQGPRSSAGAPSAPPDQRMAGLRLPESQCVSDLIRSIMCENVCLLFFSRGGSDIRGRRKGEESDEGSAADSPGPCRQETLKVTREKLQTDYSLLASVAREEELVAPAQLIPHCGLSAHVRSEWRKARVETSNRAHWMTQCSRVWPERSPGASPGARTVRARRCSSLPLLGLGAILGGTLKRSRVEQCGCAVFSLFQI